MSIKRLRSTAVAAALAAFAAGPAGAQDKTELTMYYPVAVGGPLTEIVDSLVGEFETEHPDIDVNAIYAGNYNDARIKALAALESGEPAELSVMFSIDLYELTEQNAIVPISDLVEGEEGQAWLDSFYPALMKNGQLDGQTWSIPFQRSTIVMYYNKDAFREAGLDPEQPPQNWDELVEMGKKLTKRDGGEVERWGVMIPSTGYPYWMFQALAIQNDQELMSADGTEVFFDAAPTVEAMEYWRSLGAEHGVMPEGTVEWGTLREAFLQGQTAIMWHSTGNLTAVRDNADFDFGVAMLPEKERRGSPTGGGNFYIFAGASEEESEAALILIQWMTEPERTAEWSIKTGYMATRPDAYETDRLKEYTEEFPPAAVARDQLEYSVPELSTYETGRVRKLLDDAIQSVLTGQASAEEALGGAQAQADRLLSRYR